MLPKFVVCVTVFLLLYITATFAEESGDPIITLPEGKIKGHILRSVQNKQYYAYQQIPYASPPVEDLRFKEPQQPKSWDDVLDATSNTFVCFQGGKAIPTGTKETEDCLYINVYTPVVPDDTKASLPVMVWIHGGDYSFGDGTFQSYGPQLFIDQNVIVVTFNYRLGPFGFLTTADGVIPGNIGLRDQIFALQWVNKNIQLFGGDNSKVTIVGQSAGASAVGYHIVGQKSAGLFKGAIMQSGTVLCSSGYQPNAPYFAFAMGRALDPTFNSENSNDLLKLLQSSPVENINKAIIDIPQEMVIGLGEKNLIWLPIIENIDFSGLIVNPMHSSIESGNIVRIPIMLGFNSEEEIAYIGDGEDLINLGSAMDANFSRMINIKFNMTSGGKQIAGRCLRQIYTIDTFQNDFAALVRFMSDQAYTTPIIRHADLQAKYTKVYLYQFAYKGVVGGLNFTSVKDIDTVGHGEDLNYMWKDSESINNIIPVSDRVTQAQIVKLWTNFIKYGNPTDQNNMGMLGNIEWQPVTENNLNYLNINRTLEMKTDPKRYKEFQDCIKRYASPPLVTY